MTATGMRLVHLSDIHLGYRQFHRQTAAGINQREADVAAVFRAAIDKVIALRPELVLIAGDVFHHVRPSNPAILQAFTHFYRLTQALPDTTIVMVAGNHDTPRATENVCILRLFTQLGFHVVDTVPQRLAFPERNLSVLAVPNVVSRHPKLDPDPAFEHNILLLHGKVLGVVPAPMDPEQTSTLIEPEEIGAARWTYVALGHYHVFHQLAPNAFYSGALEYTSLNVWGELQEEKAARLAGKGLVEFNLETGRRTFHSVRAARALVDLPPIAGRGMAAADIDVAIREHVDRVPGGIDDKIVRQVARDVPRHIARELDQRALRDYRRRALHFHLDTRRPEIVRRYAFGAPARRPSLMDTVRESLRSRPLPPDIDRDTLMELGLQYLREADNAEHEALAVSAADAPEDGV